ncbi:MAG: GNAT family N-acetyltransferase [Acidimicrobiia bacterium]|nr:GNAT family N-acetyltransferase [Acidimicrobiia bacterium]
MEVRAAGRDDLIGIGRVADAAHWEAYSALLGPRVISALLRRDYSPAAVRRRLLSGGLLVALDEGRLVGFADASVEADHIRLNALATDPERRRARVAAHLLESVRGLAADLPVSADVLLGCHPVEGYLEAQGFVPGEVIESDLFGELTVERRWWLAPA